jgi:hypothetical protein
LLESAVSIALLAEQGIVNAPRRKLRLVLESAVKYVYVDQQVPARAGVAGRSRLLGDTSKVARSSIDPIDDMRLEMLAEPAAFRAAAHSTFGALSSFVHPSRRAPSERFARVRWNEYSGFKSGKPLKSLNLAISECPWRRPRPHRRCLSPSAGQARRLDVRRTRWVAEVSRCFDHMAERQGQDA